LRQDRLIAVVPADGGLAIDDQGSGVLEVFIDLPVQGISSRDSLPVRLGKPLEREFWGSEPDRPDFDQPVTNAQFWGGWLTARKLGSLGHGLVPDEARFRIM
jgi:hypothetical protein